MAATSPPPPEPTVEIIGADPFDVGAPTPPEPGSLEEMGGSPFNMGKPTPKPPKLNGPIYDDPDNSDFEPTLTGI